MLDKELPKITKSMASLAAVETGCCLKSCGGSPAPLTAENKRESIDKLDQFLE